MHVGFRWIRKSCRKDDEMFFLLRNPRITWSEHETEIFTNKSLFLVHALVAIRRRPDGGLSVKHNLGGEYPISNRYGWSSHSCSCRGSKTGIVLYPYDVDHKNIVLLVCQNCYGHKSNNGTQHDQLRNWYLRIYDGSKQFRVISGFSQKDDGSLGFNSLTLNATGPYSDGRREMSSLEQNIIRKVVDGKLDSYTA